MATLIDNTRLYYTSVVAVLAALTVLVFYPGIMSFDSLQQLAEAVANRYTQHHPPILAALWHVLLPVEQGPQPMFLLNVIMFWCALLTLGLALLKDHPVLAYLVAFTCFVPPLCGMVAVIWKDNALALSWMLVCIASSVALVRGEKISWPVLALLSVVFFYGFAVRHNALAGALPLLFLMACARFGLPHTWSRIVVMLAACVALWGVCFVGAKTLNNALTGHAPTYISQELYLNDLSYMSKVRGVPVFPDYIKNDLIFSMATVRFKVSLANTSFVTYKPWETQYYTHDVQRLAELRTFWLREIMHDPMLYLSARLDVMRAFLRIGLNVYGPYELRRAPQPNDSFMQRVNNGLFRQMLMYMNKVWQSPLNQPDNWLIAGLVLLGISLWRLKKRQAVALNVGIFCMLASAYLYALPYFFIAITSDLRYLYWPIAAIYVAFILTLTQWPRRAR